MKQVISIFAFFLAVSANAQWTVVNLHPAGATNSEAHGVSGGQQVGRAVVGGRYRASLWSGTAASWVNLSPAESLNSEAYGVSGGQQVGTATVNGWYHASLWSGTAASWVDLNPAGSDYSFAYGVGGGQQVGSALVHGGSGDRASLWSGTAASWVNLSPAESLNSEAYGVSGGQQVGNALVDGVGRASLWSGTAASWVDLHPAWAAGSQALGVHGGQQVGFVGNLYNINASLWSGTAASWVDLHPRGATDSLAFGVSGGQQVGSAWVGGQERASLWSGTAASWVDLGAFLPGGFTASYAEGIWNDASFTYVAGGGYNSTTMRTEALMWVSRAVSPTSYSAVRGIVTSGNLASLLTSDNNRLVIRPGIVFTTGEPPVQIRVDATAPAAFPNGIAFSVESSASFGNAQQKIWLWNYVIGNYELVDTRMATLTDDVTNVTIRTNSSRFIQPGTLALRALVSYRAIGPSFAYPWTARIDKVWWTFPG